MKFNVFKLALAGGIGGFVYLFTLGLAGTFWDWGVPMIEVLGSLYLGFKPTLLGSAIGGAWAFVDGWVFFAILGWLYNRLT